MTKLGTMFAAASLLTVISGAAFADPAIGGVGRGTQIHHDQVTAARQQAHAALATANGHTIVANRIDARTAHVTSQENILTGQRKSAQLAMSRRDSYRTLRDEQRAAYYASHGRPGKAAFLRNRAQIKDNQSDAIRSEYGKKDLEYPTKNPANQTAH